MALFVYMLCGLTSLSCAYLLMRYYLKMRSSLLLWAGLCFVGLALNNILLFVDLAVLPKMIDLSVYRGMLAFSSMAILVYGLIWDTV